jgi:hypothetical protein
VERYGDFYVLDAPGVVDSSCEMTLYIQITGITLKAASISPAEPGTAVQVDLSVETIF